MCKVKTKKWEKIQKNDKKEQKLICKITIKKNGKFIDTASSWHILLSAIKKVEMKKIKKKYRINHKKEQKLMSMITFKTLPKAQWNQMLTKITSLGRTTSSSTNLDQISSSESQPSISFKISTKHQHFD